MNDQTTCAPSPVAAATRMEALPRFDSVSCSQCGREFGPGDNGYSHCYQHPGPQRDQRRQEQQLERRMLGAQAIGALRGLSVAGVLTNFPRNAELVADLCARWDAASDES